MSDDLPRITLLPYPGLRDDGAIIVAFRARIVREIVHVMARRPLKITNVGGARDAPALPPSRDERGSTMEETKGDDVAAESIPADQMPPPKVYPIPPKMQERLENDYVYHPARADQLPRYLALRQAAKDLAYQIVAFTPPSREQSLALTSLETAIMQANAAIAREP